MVADQFRCAWITAQFGGTEHAVDDDAEIAGRAARDAEHHSTFESTKRK
jgi:hypothetical protein